MTHTNGYSQQRHIFLLALFVFLESLVGDIKEWPNEKNGKEGCFCNTFTPT